VERAVSTAQLATRAERRALPGDFVTNL